MPELHPSTPAAPRKRDAWEVQRGVLFALVLREMKGRVGGQWVGAVWTLIEPLMHVLVMLTIFTTIRAGGMLVIETAGDASSLYLPRRRYALRRAQGRHSAREPLKRPRKTEARQEWRG